MATEVDLSAGELRIVLSDAQGADALEAELAPVRYDAAERVVGERDARAWCIVRDLSVRRDGDLLAARRVRYDLLVDDLDQRHLVVVDDLAILAVDDSLVALGLPDLDVRWWARAADQIPWVVSVTAVPVDGAIRLIAVGELDVSSIDLEGAVIWRSRAFADVLSGPVSLVGGALLVEDFNRWVYRVDVRTGETELVKGGSPGF